MALPSGFRLALLTGRRREDAGGLSTHALPVLGPMGGGVLAVPLAGDAPKAVPERLLLRIVGLPICGPSILS